MRAAFHTGKEKVEVLDVPLPTLSPGECLVQVKACAICGSDEWWESDPKEPTGTPQPLVPGHEVSGVITEVGEGVEGWNVRDRVVVYIHVGCGECPACKREMYTYCHRGPRGFTRAGGGGGFAEYTTVPVRALLPLDPSFDFVEGSLLTDNLGTPMRALRRAVIEPGATVAVWGLGPLGLVAVQGARALGAGKVVGFDPIPLRRRLALELGVDSAVDPRQPDAFNGLRSVTGAKGADCCVCTVRNNEVAQRGCSLVRKGGWFVSLAGQALIGGEYEVYASGAHYFAKHEYQGNVELVKSGRVKLRPIVTHTFPLERIQEAFETRFKHQDSAVKVVIVNAEQLESEPRQLNHAN